MTIATDTSPESAPSPTTTSISSNSNQSTRSIPIINNDAIASNRQTSQSKNKSIMQQQEPKRASIRMKLKKGLHKCADKSLSLFQKASRRRRRRREATIEPADNAATILPDDSVTILPEAYKPPRPNRMVRASSEHLEDQDALVLPFRFLCGACQPHQLEIKHEDQDDQSSSSEANRLHKDDPTVQESIECVFKSRHARSMSTTMASDEQDDENKRSNNLQQQVPEQYPKPRTSKLYRYKSHCQSDVIQSHMDLAVAASPKSNTETDSSSNEQGEQDSPQQDAAASTSPQNTQQLLYPLVAPSSSLRAGRQETSQLLLAWQKESSQQMHVLAECENSAIGNRQNSPTTQHKHENVLVQQLNVSSKSSGKKVLVGDLIVDHTTERPRSSRSQQEHDGANISHVNVSPQTSLRPASSPQQTSSSILPKQLHDAPSWPQYPLLLRANAQTRVLGVRFSASNSSSGVEQNDASSSSKHYLWTPDSPHSWQHALHQEWKQSQREATSKHAGFDATAPPSASDIVLPVNNGNEPLGRALVTDFETDLFRGTLLLRIRHTEGTTPHAYDDSRGYFDGVNRRYQAVIRGQFKQALPWTDLLTGFHLDKPCGRLPPKFIVKSALKVISFFAPQMQAQISGQNPHCLTPLGSTPQCIMVHAAADKASIGLMDDVLAEPTVDEHTLLNEASSNASSLHRARHRKKNFDRLYAAAKSDTRRDSSVMTTDPDKIYTFEFLQHLFDFDSFAIELGSVLGSIPLAPILHGQPLQIMACTSKVHYVWGFELWHSALMDDFKQQHDEAQGE
ncbi:hypothetical protein MPSEU_000670700 [Mayamaea pseudoterrestris]|nr:hypothetical protein MPSEU_000670700 [Mayamaea pseudoterrestris]